jgi:hypothetical protein
MMVTSLVFSPTSLRSYVFLSFEPKLYHLQEFHVACPEEGTVVCSQPEFRLGESQEPPVHLT